MLNSIKSSKFYDNHMQTALLKLPSYTKMLPSTSKRTGGTRSPPMCLTVSLYLKNFSFVSCLLIYKYHHLVNFQPSLEIEVIEVLVNAKHSGRTRYAWDSNIMDNIRNLFKLGRLTRIKSKRNY